jgi:4-hydroxy-4-methyl-2-oxoglutarate aldolase
MGFPVWSRHVSAFGTVKETLGSVNVGLVCAGQWIEPGDVVVADDDGVVVVPRTKAPQVLAASRSREEKEAGSRERYQRGELGLDVHAMRERLTRKGLTYVDQDGAE